MKKLFKYFKPELTIAILGIIFVGVSAFIELYQIQLMAEIIDVGIANANFTIILNVGLKMMGLALLGLLFGMIGLIFPSQASNNFALRLREEVFAKIQTYSIKNMSEFKSSSLVTRLTNDINFLQRAVMMSLRMLVRAPVFLVSTVVLTYLTSPELSLVMFGAVFILSIIFFLVVRQGFPRFMKLQDQIDKMNRKIQESLMNIRVIKSFVREEDENKTFKKENEDLYEVSVHANILMTIMNPALIAAINFATIVVVYVSGHLIVDYGLIQLGDLLVFVNYLRFTMFSMLMITHVLMMLSRSKASIVRINQILETDSDISSDPDTENKNIEEGHIVFDNVSFQYYKEAECILSELNFEIKPGENVGIIGSTGSGKSTLIHLLARLIDVTEGRILLDGTDIRDMDLKKLREQFGFVPQHNVLFSGTVAENLRLGNKDASLEELKKATKAADIYDYLMGEPDQFESVVQQGGSNFSGGQKQRLSIARALVTDPKILVLDDSTSALDAATEARVKESLDKLYSDITIINVAQKISSIIDSDNILVLDQGKIVGQGTHDELIKDCHVYQEIYDSQMEKGELE
ncbi:MAG: ABC transporter ATP-binding protein [Clostridium sp.]|nr:ABC transporter ATP-binding protein [Clostridium sp.]